jgi:hypothetical protein
VLLLFRGQIESPAKSLSSLIINEDMEVLVAINTSGLYVIDPVILAYWSAVLFSSVRYLSNLSKHRRIFLISYRFLVLP